MPTNSYLADSQGRVENQVTRLHQILQEDNERLGKKTNENNRQTYKTERVTPVTRAHYLSSGPRRKNKNMFQNDQIIIKRYRAHRDGDGNQPKQTQMIRVRF